MGGDVSIAHGGDARCLLELGVVEFGSGREQFLRCVLVESDFRFSMIRNRRVTGASFQVRSRSRRKQRGYDVQQPPMGRWRARFVVARDGARPRRVEFTGMKGRVGPLRRAGRRHRRGRERSEGGAKPGSDMVFRGLQRGDQPRPRSLVGNLSVHAENTYLLKNV